MGFLDRLSAAGRSGARALRSPRPDGSKELHVGDPRFDDWPLVRDFETLADARAWRQHLETSDIEAVLTADWQLDEFGRGDIALRVPPGLYSAADELLSDYDL